MSQSFYNIDENQSLIGRVFKYWCRSRADKLAKKNLNYACLSTAIAEGGILMAFIVRLSVIPT